MSSFEYESYRADRLRDAEEEVVRLQAALLQYGTHRPDCARRQESIIETPECTCGLSLALARAAVRRA